MTPTIPSTEELLRRAARGDDRSRQQLLDRHRDRLRHMVTVRLDRRLAARLDASDVVQDVLTEAAQKLSAYLQERPLPYYPWLRQIAWERLIKLHRRHLRTQKRTITREAHSPGFLPDESAAALAACVLSSNNSPSKELIRREERQRVQAALRELNDRDREVLVMRYLEHLSMSEIAATIGCSEGAVQVRHVRALKRLRRLLVEEFGEAEA